MITRPIEDEKRVSETLAIHDCTINKSIVLFIGFVNAADNEVGGGEFFVCGWQEAFVLLSFC